MKTEKIIMYDSPEAATHRTDLSGWVSGGGLYFGKSEDLARFAGCTHKRCECGQTMQKHYTKCKACREQMAKERYDAREKRRWDYDGPVYSDTNDRYFLDRDELDEYCDECDCKPKELWLLTCKKIDPPIINDSYFDDDLQEGEELPAEIIAAIDETNKIIAKHWPASWEPTKYAVDLEGKMKIEIVKRVMDLIDLQQ